ncbi:GNAT family N-acetyltransferase [Roseovarius sp. 2305UL8-3]|uniref:GNAT family N-acetyltransferase n=1 Tax=Roseovarius conchicola TaxID=3121636 RepID=UPI0035273FAF
MITCRAYDAGQEQVFLTLYRACLQHYQIPAATPEQEARIVSLLTSGRHMSCLLAYDGARTVGFATWALTFPAGAGVALYLKELFVLREARGLGAGRALLAGLLEIAEAEGCTRMDWQTDRDNARSQSFYASIKAPAFDKLTYRVAAADFSTFRSSLL